MADRNSRNMLTFGGHLEVLRRMLFRIIAVVGVVSIVVFLCKDAVWKLLLAPSEYNFLTYRWIEHILNRIGIDFYFDEFHINLIATDLSSQFMRHITTSLYLGLLGASPYVLFELFYFIAPALSENEKKYSGIALFIIYFLFILGVFMSYYVLFPISFRFLGTYSVADRVHSTITLDSYISTFTTLTFLMGIFFQLPIIAFALAKLGIVNSETLSKYRKHSFLVIMLVAAIITPPDIMTLILVTLPLYLLYELSIKVTHFVKA